MKAKQLTDILAAGSDKNIILAPPLCFELKRALGLIDDDKLAQVTPRDPIAQSPRRNMSGRGRRERCRVSRLHRICLL